MRRFRTSARRFTPVLLIFLWGQLGSAEEFKGQADFEAATAARLGASSMADLERVIELTKSALEKGLDEESQVLAKSLLTSTLFRHGSRFAQALFDPRERSDRPAMLKQFALKDLYEILEHDDQLPEVYMMIARLEGVNVGQTQDKGRVQRGRDAAEKAIELLDDDKPLQSKALLLRAGYEGPASEKRIEFLNRAIEVDEKNEDAWRLRGKTRLVQGEMLSANGQLDASKGVREQAMSDFMKLLTDNPEDPDALQSAAEIMGRLGDFDKAFELADQAIKLNPTGFSVYLLRARLYHKQQKYDLAIKDLDKAVDIQPGSFLAYLDRAEFHYDAGNKDSAAKDYGKAREIKGEQLPRIVLERMLIRSQKNIEKGIAEIKKFLEIDELNAKIDERDPDPDYRLQLSTTYLSQQDLQASIEVLTPLLEEREQNPTNNRARNARYIALSSRANTYLTIGEHSKAIADYQDARKISDNNSNVLNNLAWVLSTSPDDEIRDPKLAVELATKACKLTEFKAPHIISTLAAAYADAGDFDNAKKYSAQAVELSEAVKGPDRDEEMTKQLKSELESYQRGEPWRELQNGIEETADAEDDDNEEEVVEVDATDETVEQEAEAVPVSD